MRAIAILPQRTEEDPDRSGIGGGGRVSGGGGRVSGGGRSTAVESFGC